MALFAPILAALTDAECRFVVVGGVAVVLQGHARLTADLDLVVDLEAAAARRAIAALVGLGFQPRAPVSPEEFADAERRREWIETKGMEVLSLFDPGRPLLGIDLFVQPPLPFEELWREADVLDVGGLDVRVASIPHLVEMKERVGRPQDREDVARLLEILRRREGSDGR